MEKSGDAPSLFFTRMDLNQTPIGQIEVDKEPISLKAIRFECRKKIAAKEAIVKRFGEVGYEKVIQDPSPFLMIGTSGEAVIVFILH